MREPTGGVRYAVSEIIQAEARLVLCGLAHVGVLDRLIEQGDHVLVQQSLALRGVAALLDLRHQVLKVLHALIYSAWSARSVGRCAWRQCLRAGRGRCLGSAWGDTPLVPSSICFFISLESLAQIARRMFDLSQPRVRPSRPSHSFQFEPETCT
jgi:hypothetical protein